MFNSNLFLTWGKNFFSVESRSQETPPGTILKSIEYAVFVMFNSTYSEIIYHHSIS
jgi:hypothetical protein